jgi:hypothetical protein
MAVDAFFSELDAIVSVEAHPPVPVARARDRSREPQTRASRPESRTRARSKTRVAQPAVRSASIARTASATAPTASRAGLGPTPARVAHDSVTPARAQHGRAQLPSASTPLSSALAAQERALRAQTQMVATMLGS